MADALGVIAADLIRDILIKGSAEVGVKNLDAAADAPDRFLLFDERLY